MAEKKEEVKTTNVVTNGTKGYGYNYASLGDIASQGFEIPKMRVAVKENGAEYIEYYDKELKEWINGAKVVTPKMSGSNEAQIYGSAITYARRYTTLLALGLACNDDKEIENTNADGSKKEGEPTGKTKTAPKVESATAEVKLATPRQIQTIIENKDLLVEEFKKMGIEKPSQLKELSLDKASALIHRIVQIREEANKKEVNNG